MQITKNIQQLIKKLNLDAQIIKSLYHEDKQFPLKVPDSFVSRMQKGEINDPLLRQILPTKTELKQAKGYTQDPLSEAKYSPVPGLIHKYDGRVLIAITDKCPINCRFCFRRHIHHKIENWNRVLNYVNKNKNVSEVILSGGDPLMLSQTKLQKMITDLVSISHLKRLRIHTRVPIVLPEIINHKLLEIITQHRLKVVIVVHCNHPNEINNAVKMAIKICQEFNLTLLNQTVLLKGINDSADILTALSEQLFAQGIIPYYLHLLDKVNGSRQFYVAKIEAIKLFRELQCGLPGFLVPKLVKDVVEAPAKRLII